MPIAESAVKLAGIHDGVIYAQYDGEFLRWSPIMDESPEQLAYSKPSVRIAPRAVSVVRFSSKAVHDPGCPSGNDHPMRLRPELERP